MRHSRLNCGRPFAHRSSCTIPLFIPGSLSPPHAAYHFISIARERLRKKCCYVTSTKSSCLTTNANVGRGLCDARSYMEYSALLCAFSLLLRKLMVSAVTSYASSVSRCSSLSLFTMDILAFPLTFPSFVTSLPGSHVLPSYSGVYTLRHHSSHRHLLLVVHLHD